MENQKQDVPQDDKKGGIRIVKFLLKFLQLKLRFSWSSYKVGKGLENILQKENLQAPQAEEDDTKQIDEN